MEILILLMLAVAVIFALRYIRLHPSSCSGNCSGCGAACKNRKDDEVRSPDL